MIPARHLISAEALRRCDDTGEPIYTTAERIVLALRWFDWVSAAGLREVLDLDDADEVDARRYSIALGRLVKRGIVEARGNGKHGNADVRREYRLVADSPALPLRDTPAMAKWRIG